ncbi:hypothetical protein STRTUCAR8_02851 [Streptomyces turgidiscabies Car8]|uniref:Uncharacterized protein n=1 Tax=Streptomyces turgidiscabies (strain Car8) TaxID=698760 RepID=L7ESS2_STRT8|nr:hypothetical protein STRTUCAR8_02851 [Streptomyces turgidiscabies Car8]
MGRLTEDGRRGREGRPQGDPPIMRKSGCLRTRISVVGALLWSYGVRCPARPCRW